jgi:hypothetical protein
VRVKAEGPEGIIFECDVAAAEVKTAFDALMKAAEQSDVEVKYTGGSGSPYISGIDGIMEKSDGALSGWIYKVNGEQAGVGCGKYDVAAGDRVSFFFTRDLGKDCADKE